MDFLTNSVVGAILNNLLNILNMAPTVIVMIYLLLIVRTTRRQMSRLIEGGHGADGGVYQTQQIDQVTENVDNGLKVLYAFGLVYIIGFGLDFVVGINDLINLSGYADVVERWRGKAKFCEFELVFYEVSNVLLNLLNSLIIVQSKMVRGALKQVLVTTASYIKGSSSGQERRRLLKEYHLIGNSSENNDV